MTRVTITITIDAPAPVIRSTVSQALTDILKGHVPGQPIGPRIAA